MIGPFDYHVFAHVRGRYQTAEMSAGVTGVEKAACEQFLFGQTNDEQYLASLSQEPGVVWRRCGERCLLTRVLQGPPDADKRVTLRFETLLIPVAQAKAVAEVFAGLVVSPWEKRSDGMVVPKLRESTSRTLHPQAISDVALAARDGKRCVRSATDVSLRDVQKIIENCHALRGFSLCYKSLSGQASATVNFVADSANMRRAPVSTAMAPPKPSLPPARVQCGHRGVRASATVFVLFGIVLAVQVFTLIYVASAVNPGGQIKSSAQNVILERIELKSAKVLEQVSEAQNKVIQKETEGQKALQQSLDSANSALATLSKTLNEAQQALQGRVTEVHKGIAKNVEDGMADLRESQQVELEALRRDLAVLADVDDAIRDANKRTAAVHERLGRARTLIEQTGKLLAAIRDNFEQLKEEARGRSHPILERLQLQITMLEKAVKDAQQAIGEQE